MNTYLNRSECSKNHLESFPLKIKQMIYGYLPVQSMLNFKLASKDLNNNYHVSKEQLNKLFLYKKRFNHGGTYKLYLQSSEPTRADFEKAIKDNKFDIVKVLLEDARTDPTVNFNFSIGLASENGYTEIVKILLKDERVVPSANYDHAIRWASKNGHTDVVETLLKDGRVNPSVHDNFSIKFASERG
ncbi:hypothetical protein BC833DRAFT_612927, partial [Globomyces pollinis-pini]